MKKKIWILIITILILLLAIIIYKTNFSGNANAKNNELKVSLGSEPNSLDPAISLTIDVRSYLSNIFEGLVNIDEKGNAVAGVACEWKANENNTEYIFKLRDDAKWSDGSRVTANDFKYEWLRVLNPDTASGWASYLYYIKGAEDYNTGKGTTEDVGIEVIDETTLKVYMENPCSFFISMTALQPYYPVKESVIIEYGNAWSNSSETLISNGAFKLENWEHDAKITLVKNTDYWNRNNIKLEKITYELFSDSTTVLNSYEAKSIDFAENMLTAEEMKQVAEIKTADFVYTKFLALNMDNTILKDNNIRQAIAIALDRETISNTMGETISPLLTFIPYGFYNSAEGKDYTEDSNAKIYYNATSKIQQAKELLKQSGYENGEGLPKLIYLTNTSSTNMALAEIVKSQLSKIGIEVEIQALEKKIFNTYRRERKFDIVAASWAAEYPDITSYLYGFKSNDINNYAGFKNQEFDEIYSNILKENSNENKYRLVHKAEDLAMLSYAIIPLYKEKTCYVSSDALKGYYHDVTGCLQLNYAYFE